MKLLKLISISLFLLWSIPIRSQNPTLTKEGNTVNSKQNDADSLGPDWGKIKEKMVVGGGFGLSFFADGATNYTLFQISPQAGYKIKENLIAGAGVQLLSISSKKSTYWEYGPDIFLRAHLADILFVQTQFEYMNFEDYLLPGKRVWNSALLFGFGYGTYGYSFGLYTCINKNRFTDQLYPGNIYIAGQPFFIKAQLLFNLVK